MSAPLLDRNTCVLVVGADESFSRPLSLDLKASGYAPVVASDAILALRQTEELQPGLIVVDRESGQQAGVWLCGNLRRSGNRAPVLMVMDSETIADRAACLEAGADDYLLKPYRCEEFLKRVRFYLQPETPEVDRLRFADLILDLSSRRAFRGQRTIELTMKEFELLKFLMEHPREVLSRDRILENVWGYDFLGESNVIEVYVRYLRLKLEDDDGKRLIQTVRGVGYVLREV